MRWRVAAFCRELARRHAELMNRKDAAIVAAANKRMRVALISVVLHAAVIHLQLRMGETRRIAGSTTEYRSDASRFNG
jgi:hypothetical protein